MNKRVTYFDLAKGIGIILVVLGHMENIPTELRVWISSFHMPLFFVISGMLIAYRDNADIKKLARGILIPYFWFSLIYIPIDVMNLYIDNVDMHTFIQNILDSVTLSGVSVMWFLPALFIAEVTLIALIYIIRKAFGEEKCQKNNCMFYACLLLAGLLISILTQGVWGKIKPVYDANSQNYVYATLLGFIRVVLRGLAMSVHVVIGYVMFRLMLYIEEKIISLKVEKASVKVEEEIKVIKETGANEIRGIELALGIIMFVLNMGLCLKNEAVDNHFLTLNNLPLYYVCAFLGSMSIILICKGLDHIAIIEFLGKNSLIIMATHLQCYLLYAGILIAIAIDTYVTRAKSYIYMFNSVLFTMLFEVVVILVINKFFPFITGKGSIVDLFKKKSE